MNVRNILVKTDALLELAVAAGAQTRDQITDYVLEHLPEGQEGKDIFEAVFYTLDRVMGIQTANTTIH